MKFNQSRAIVALSAILCLAILPSCAGRSASCKPATREQHAILALIFHADWCVPCVQVEQVLAQVEPRFHDRPVLFVEFDLTHEVDWEKAKYMAAALGVMEIFDAQQGELGKVFLIDANSKKVLNYLDATHGPKEMASRIDAALNQALTSK